jgi:hypothetical protein
LEIQPITKKEMESEIASLRSKDNRRRDYYDGDSRSRVRSRSRKFVFFPIHLISKILQVLDHVHQKIVIHADIHHGMIIPTVIILEIPILADLAIMKVNLTLLF